MKITTDRTNTPEGNLVFTITISEPHISCFGVFENDIMKILDICKDDINRAVSVENKTKDDVISLIHLAKEKLFTRVLNNLKFAIENEFRPKFKPICQEIYNWIYDHQEMCLKTWMLEFDPQRTKYYFDNDPENKAQSKPNIVDDKFDDEEEDYDDDV